MMSRPQKYIEGEALHSQHAKSNNALKLKVAVLVVCVLLVSALVVTYLWLELLKTRDMLRTLELKQETIKNNVTERGPEIKPCGAVQPTCPPQPEVKIITKPCSISSTPQLPEVDMVCCNLLKDECEEGWESHAGMCYYFSTCKCSWNTSSTECRAKGGNLVKIDSEDEQRFLTTAIQPKISRYEDKFWIGLTDSAEEGRWLWVDGSPLNERLTFWFVHQPDDWTKEDPDGEDCGRIGPIYWYDKSCKAHQRSICEKPAVDRHKIVNEMCLKFSST